MDLPCASWMRRGTLRIFANSGLPWSAPFFPGLPAGKQGGMPFPGPGPPVTARAVQNPGSIPVRLKLFMGIRPFFRMEGSIRTPGSGNAKIVLETGSDPRGFLSRYILALTPLFLLILSAVTTAMLRGIVAGVPMSIPTPMGNLAPGMGDMVETLILLTAPVGIFTLFGAIGWAIRSREMWISSVLALGLSSLGGIFLVIFFPVSSMSR